MSPRHNKKRQDREPVRHPILSFCLVYVFSKSMVPGVVSFRPGSQKCYICAAGLTAAVSAVDGVDDRWLQVAKWLFYYSVS